MSHDLGAGSQLDQHALFRGDDHRCKVAGTTRFSPSDVIPAQVIGGEAASRVDQEGIGQG